jgi:hypothetical protein
VLYGLQNAFKHISDLIHTSHEADAVAATPTSVSIYVPLQAYGFLLQMSTTLI